MERFGIILAAGLGERVCNSELKISAKPLVNVNNLSLLLRTIKSHEVACCSKVIIVLGWQAESVKSYILSEYKGQIELIFVYNNNYRLNNGISVLCARPFVSDEFILTMADHILDDGIMELANNCKPPVGGTVLCVDYKLEKIFDMEDATKVFERNGYINAIGKDIIDYNCIDTGVFIGTQGLMRKLAEIYVIAGDVSLTEGVQALAKHNLIKTLDIKDCFWQDVDNHEMLKHAEKILNKHKNK